MLSQSSRAKDAETAKRGSQFVALPSCFLGMEQNRKTNSSAYFCFFYNKYFMLLLVLSFPSEYNIVLSSYSGKAFRQYLMQELSPLYLNPPTYWLLQTTTLEENIKHWHENAIFGIYILYIYIAHKKYINTRDSKNWDICAIFLKIFAEFVLFSSKQEKQAPFYSVGTIWPNS